MALPINSFIVTAQMAQVKVFNDIVINIDRNVTVILSLLDLSAAFDTVDHFILLNRWER